MANLDPLENKSTEKNYTIIQPAEELDKLNDNSVPEDNISPILLVLCAVIPIISLLIILCI
ncbi:hypothetical protein ACJDU8_23140 [Clostridium sp. WILCCON 0269]|uniref:Uncharacterized protein n=1 Tax=Candidatus Clostridium eludens TaxID=3381663 RepID=A0ABW8SRS7_9CLOT